MINKAYTYTILAALLAIGNPAPATANELAPADDDHDEPAMIITEGDDSLTTIAQKIAEIHGGAGPWALLGYRMGDYAARQLSVEPHTRELDITHDTIMQPQFTCIADGVAAATGNSLGQMNLRLDAVETTTAIETTFRKKATSETLTLRLRPEVYQKFTGIPHTPEAFHEANQKIMRMSDQELFSQQ